MHLVTRNIFTFTLGKIFPIARLIKSIALYWRALYYKKIFLTFTLKNKKVQNGKILDVNYFFLSSVEGVRNKSHTFNFCRRCSVNLCHPNTFDWELRLCNKKDASRSLNVVSIVTSRLADHMLVHLVVLYLHS